jgi:hypothetical protein
VSTVIRRVGAPLWLAAAGLFALATAIVFYHVPIAGAAFYEYAGHRIVDGATLYRDVWDNKLPSIYYLNAFYQLAFGSHYVLHWAVELVVLLATGALFANFARRARLRSWAPATFALVAFLAMPPLRHFGYTEPYAAFLIVLALVAAQRGAPIASGAILAIAATFWTPAALQVAAILVLIPDATARRRVAGAFVTSAMVLAAIFLTAFGAGPIFAGLREIYGWQGVRWDRTFPRVEAHQLWYVLTSTGLVVPIAVALGVMRRPSSDRERFALVWLAGALAGAAISLGFSEHEFIPSVAPLVFTIATYAERVRFSLVRSAALAAVAVALVLVSPKIGSAMRAGIADKMEEGRGSIVVGRMLDASLPTASRIAVYGYDSGIYLTARREVAGRFPNHAYVPANDPASDAEYLVGIRGADAIVTARETVLFPGLATLLRSEYAAPCSVGPARFQVYLRRTLRAAAFCPREEKISGWRGL